jgi:hypothetical protein
LSFLALTINIFLGRQTKKIFLKSPAETVLMHLAVQNGFTYDALFEILPIFLLFQFLFIEFTVFIFQAFFSQKIETNRLKSLFGNRDNLTRTLSDQIVVHRSVKIGFWEIITCRVM